ncbi:MAG: CHAT domain-containing protein [Pirellulales bacterium]|nr:CHAT domain-containing protein [Pirellulales bacterium]
MPVAPSKSILLQELLKYVILAAVLFSGSTASAQQERMTPSLMYFAHFNLYYEGDYLDALKAFQSDARGSIKSGTMRWIDSICYLAMIGECYYQMGVLDKALDAYTDALRLYVMYPDWMVRMQFTPNLRPAGVGSRKQVPWGASKIPVQIGHFPTSVLMSQGKSPEQNEQAYKHGGVIQQAIMYPINPQEIVRCTALAIRRRAELLGPLSKSDALTADVASKTVGVIGPPNHWSEAWTDLQRGVAYVAAGKPDQAFPYLQRSQLAAGEFEHPLTGVARLELGRIKLQQGDFKSAAAFFEEATYAAADFADYGVLEEALRHAALAHLMANQQGVCPLLQPAAAWSKLKILRASAGISLAENLAVVGQTRAAAGVLDEVRAVIGRRSMASGRIGGRLNYVSSVVLFQDRKTAEAQKALADALAYMKHGSHWLFHINLVDAYHAAGGGRPEGARLAMGLYDEVLRDPLPLDWALEPLESLAVLTTPHSPSYERWFEAAMQRKEIQDTAMEIADRARRHRFFTSLPLGGRLQTLRWILEAPPEWLDRQTALQRQEILTRYPEYAKLAEQAAKLRQKLLAMPLAPEDKTVARDQAAALAELASASAQQELILHEIAVRREPADMAFPPVRKTQDIKKALPDGHAVLAFFSCNRRMYAFLMNNAKYSSWTFASPAVLQKQIVAMLRDMGLFASVGELPLKDLAGTKWKTSAAKVLELLTKNSPADFSKSFKELVIVPDGFLWYLPFEALQVPIDGRPQSLLSRFRIRYAPTLSLAVSPYPPARRASGKTAVAWGKLPIREQEEALKSAREKLEAAVPGITPLKWTPAPSSIYGVLVSQLLVFDDLIFDDKDPYNWLPIPLDRNKPGGTVHDWLALPWGHPTEIILPAFHTPAEDSMNPKRLARFGLPGNEVFLNACGLMSTGARTILLSRWRTGGQTSCDLVREFVQELPHTSPADAWQRAVLLTMDSRLAPEAEPRVKKSAGDDTPKAEHPFFWSGYMLLDGGEPGVPSKPAPQEPVNKAKLPVPNPLNPVPPPLMPGDNTKPEEKQKENAIP